MARVALIGCGGISNSHVRGWNGLEKDKAHVVATADIVIERARERAKQLDAQDYYTDYEEILKRDDIDCVDICLPHYLHKEVTVKAAEHGKHVLCEKPMARTLEEAREMIKACQENDVVLLIGHISRFSPENIKCKSMIDSGMVGKIFLVRIMQGFHPGLKEFHYKKDRIGGGVLISTGTHAIDLARWLVGDIKRVSYMGNSFIRGLEGEDTAVMTLEFENGAVGSLVSSWAVRPSEVSVWIYGEKGTITTQDRLRFFDITGEVTQPEVRASDPFRGELNHFIDCIRSRKTTVISGEEGYKSLEVAIAAYKSGAEQRIVDIAELR